MLSELAVRVLEKKKIGLLLNVDIKGTPQFKEVNGYYVYDCIIREGEGVHINLSIPTRKKPSRLVSWAIEYLRKRKVGVMMNVVCPPYTFFKITRGNKMFIIDAEIEEHT